MSYQDQEKGESEQGVEVTPKMITAGVDAYLGRASHDELSFSTPAEVVESVLRAALTVDGQRQSGYQA